MGPKKSPHADLDWLSDVITANKVKQLDNP